MLNIIQTMHLLWYHCVPWLHRLVAHNQEYLFLFSLRIELSCRRGQPWAPTHLVRVLLGAETKHDRCNQQMARGFRCDYLTRAVQELCSYDDGLQSNDHVETMLTSAVFETCSLTTIDHDHCR